MVDVRNKLLIGIPDYFFIMLWGTKIIKEKVEKVTWKENGKHRNGNEGKGKLQSLSEFSGFKKETGVICDWLNF